MVAIIFKPNVNKGYRRDLLDKHDVNITLDLVLNPMYPIMKNFFGADFVEKWEKPTPASRLESIIDNALLGTTKGPYYAAAGAFAGTVMPEIKKWFANYFKPVYSLDKEVDSTFNMWPPPKYTGNQSGEKSDLGKQAAINVPPKTTSPFIEVFQTGNLSYSEYAKTITTEATPALEALNEQVENNNLLMQFSNGQFGALIDSYSDYSQVVDNAANSIRMMTETEAVAATSKSTTAQVLTTALDATQTKVDRLAGDSLVQLSDAFAGAIVKGESFGEALKSMGENILYTIIQMQALSWITSLFGGTGGMEKFGTFTPSNSILNLSPSSPYGAWGSVMSAIFSAKGNVFGPQGLKAFAKGGIVSKPTLFGFAKGIGLMGEAGAEAIMPLGRDSRGNLGVRVADSAGSAGGVFAPHVEINVENKGGGDMSEEQARTLGTQVKAIVEMQVAKQMYEYMRNGTLRPSMGRGY